MKNQAKLTFRTGAMLLAGGSLLGACGGGTESASATQLSQAPQNTLSQTSGSDYDRPLSNVQRPLSDSAQSPVDAADDGDFQGSVPVPGGEPVERPSQGGGSVGGCDDYCRTAGDCDDECEELCEDLPQECAPTISSTAACVGAGSGSCEERLTVCLLTNAIGLASCAQVQ